MLFTAKENAFSCKKQKSTPKKRIFRVPYAVNSTPYAIKERWALHLFIVGQAVKRHINSDGSCTF